jgi:hypothetical protein
MLRFCPVSRLAMSAYIYFEIGSNFICYGLSNGSNREHTTALLTKWLQLVKMLKKMAMGIAIMEGKNTKHVRN